MEIEKFKEDTPWKIRVLNYDEDSAELMGEIVDYHARQEMNSSKQTSFQFLIIDKIKFRTIDTGNLLRAVALNKIPLLQQLSKPDTNYEITRPEEKIIARPIERPIAKSLFKNAKIPFDKIQFLNGFVSFTLFIEEICSEITFEIENPDIRPEYEAIKNYFSKVLKKNNQCFNSNLLFGKADHF